ncbi:MAG: hypothetical protein NC238_05285 [Dehalobacter sp.]|nr:hypothetical protein [Dehalobacter sp.]
MKNNLKENLISWQFLLLAFVSLVPHLLYTAGADFAGMLSVYRFFPAGMGFFTFFQLYLVFFIFNWTSPSIYFSAILFSFFCARILQIIDRKDMFAAHVFYAAAFLVVFLAIVTGIMSPD